MVDMDSIRGKWQGARSASTKFYTALTSTGPGLAGAQGFAESFGIGIAGKSKMPDWLKVKVPAHEAAGMAQARKVYSSMIPKPGSYTGILGLKGDLATLRAERAAFMSNARVIGEHAGELLPKNIGRVGMKSVLSRVGKLGIAGRLLPVAFTAHAIYEGYQEGGTLGAVKGGAGAAIEWFAFSAAMKFLPGLATATGVLAPAALIGAGTYMFGEGARQYRKQLRKVELGGGNIDPFNTGATMRQRSAMALQNSHINGRSALGAEGSLYHR